MYDTQAYMPVENDFFNISLRFFKVCLLPLVFLNFTQDDKVIFNGAKMHQQILFSHMFEEGTILTHSKRSIST